MKKEDFIQAIDNIEPDAYMKNRLKAKIFTAENSSKKAKKIPRIIIALCLTLAIVFGAGLFAAPQTPGNSFEQTSPQIFSPEIIKAFVVIASAAENETSQTQTANQTLELNKEYDYGVSLKIIDIRSLSSEEKADTLNELNNLLSHYSMESGFSLGRSMVCQGDSFYFACCSVNEFKLNLENSEKIKSVTVTNKSEYGEMVFDPHKPSFKAPEHGHNITISGEDFDCTTSGFYWNTNEEAVKAIEQNINLPFSAFNDTITFTAEYIDGSKTTAVVELNFDNSGDATAVCKSYKRIGGETKTE